MEKKIPRRFRPFAILLLMVLGLPLASLGQAPSVKIEDIPHVLQKRDFCGEACIEMACRKLGIDISQDVVFNHAELPPDQGRGCYTRELTTAARALGFETGQVGNWIAVKDAKSEMDRYFAAITTALEDGVPSIVCMRYNERPDTTEHFRLVTGYDSKTDDVLYHEPAEKNGAYRRMSRERFYNLWPLKYKTDKWLLVTLRLQPKPAHGVRAHAGKRIKRDAMTVQRVMEIKKLIATKAPDTSFNIEIRDPFIVIGDESKAKVKARADQTVFWAVKHLKKQFFSKDPEDVIAIWLFKDKVSYEKHMLAFWDEAPFTPFGYFSATEKALVMNIATGGGTLVHEIVHPFVAANFPGCAPWVDEGIASLYEQCGDRGGKITGFTNWRLAGLQTAIKRDRVPTFKTLCATSKVAFYNHDPGTNYSQSRYLMYYLQQEGLLEDFYKKYHENRATDPTGWATLQKTLGNPDMKTFQADWQKWVMTLKFP